MRRVLKTMGTTKMRLTRDPRHFAPFPPFPLSHLPFPVSLLLLSRPTKFPRPHWPLVQRQDIGLWIREWWFESTGANWTNEFAGQVFGAGLIILVPIPGPGIVQCPVG